MKRLIFVIFAALVLPSCARRHIIVLDNSLSQQNTQVILIDKKEKPKVKFVSFGVNFIPGHYPPIIYPVNQCCYPRFPY